MPSVLFGSRAAANDFRERAAEYLASSDDRRSSTVNLARGTPDRVMQRAESEAFGSQTSDRASAGQAQLSESERGTLRRTTSFDWQSHGFEAMSAKAALQERGVDAWQDYYEPGEGVDSALSKLRSAKGGAGMSSRASIGVESMRQDTAEEGNAGRRSRQAERAVGQQAKRAKKPALLEGDRDALDFLEEERALSGGGVFDISFNQSDQWGRPQPTGRDAELVEERHESRSTRAQAADESKQAPITRDPIQWARAPSVWDFPGVDTLNPGRIHGARSERAQGADESRRAPIAESVSQWAGAPDQFDLPGVDTPEEVFGGGSFNGEGMLGVGSENNGSSTPFGGF